MGGKIHGRQNNSESYLRTHPSVTCRSTQSQTMGRSFANEGYDTAEGLPRQNSAEDPSGVYGDECGTPTYREQAAQAIRPLEDISVAKMRTQVAVAFVDDATGTHNDRTDVGDFKAADGATVSVWITEHGKLGEYVCTEFTGQTVTSDSGWLHDFAGNGNPTGAATFGASPTGTDTMIGCGVNNKDCMHCDTDGDGDYRELCFTGALCNRTLPGVNGGCGVGGRCEMSRVVPNGHVLRNHPDGSGPATSRCGEDVDCENSQALKVQHSVQLPEAGSADQTQHVIWEFDHPVKLKKHTTYYVNMAIDESITKSDSIYWYAGTTTTTPQGPNRTPFLASYTRTNIEVDGQMMFTWVKNPNSHKFNLEIFRCVSSLPSIESFSTPGEPTGACSARSSPAGGEMAPTITFKGQNFYPSKNLRVVFLKEDGSMGPSSECVSTKADFTEMECVAPTFNPHMGTDCSIPGHCGGVSVMPTNDGINFGPEFFSPKYQEPYNDCTTGRSPTLGCDAVPASINGSHHFDNHFVQLLGENLLKYCFSDIYVSTSGNDYSGDGSKARPFRTIQRGIDAANPHDVIIMMPGVYTGTGNRGLRHMGKHIEITTVEADPSSQTNCWCANNVPCTDPTCTGEKKYSAGSGISYRDTTIVDCQHQADGFVLNNNKDSDSPFAGYVDFANIVTKNCENLRIYN